MIRPDERPLLLTGFMATLAGVGLARFGYTALMPQMVQAGWFSGEQAAYLGAANLLGYLFGALAAARLAELLGMRRMLAWSWTATALSFAACARPDLLGSDAHLNLAWFSLWRCISGVSGALLMVLGPSMAMAAAPVQRRAVLGPLMFCGIGFGALLSATLVPGLARISLAAVWGAMALCSALAWWIGLAQARRFAAPGPAAATTHPSRQAPGATWSAAVVLVVLAYMCDAFGFVPHTVFWVDYLAREQQLGTAYASMQWAFFGIGAIVGPLAAAFCATRLGWWGTTMGAYAVKTVAIAMPLFWASFAGHATSSFLVGALSPGMAAITSGYLMQLTGPQQHKRMWGYATAAFALMQATSGYCMAWMYASLGSYRPLFAIAGSALLLSTLMIATSRARPQTVNA